MKKMKDLGALNHNWMSPSNLYPQGSKNMQKKETEKV